MSYAAFMIFSNENPATNALRFETHEEADIHGRDLLMRWTVPIDYEVREMPDPVTHKLDVTIDGKTGVLYSIEKWEKVKHHPECSICYERHGMETIHECE